MVWKNKSIKYYTRKSLPFLKVSGYCVRHTAKPKAHTTNISSTDRYTLILCSLGSILNSVIFIQNILVFDFDHTITKKSNSLYKYYCSSTKCSHTHPYFKLSWGNCYVKIVYLTDLYTTTTVSHTIGETKIAAECLFSEKSLITIFMTRSIFSNADKNYLMMVKMMVGYFD